MIKTKLQREAGTKLVLLSWSRNMILWKVVCIDQSQFYNFLHARECKIQKCLT